MGTDIQPAEEQTSVMDDIKSSMDESEDLNETTETDEPTETVDDEVTEETVGELDDESGDEETTDVEAEPETQLSAPDHWDTKHKDMFNGWPDDVKEQYMERHKDMEGLMTQKLQEVAEMRNDFGDFYDQFAPIKANLAASGISPGQYMTNLTQADLIMNQDPIAGIQHIAQMYGIDLGQIGDATEIDPELQSVRNELNELRNNISQRDQSAANERQNTALTNIQSFSGEKDADGNTLHPYFEEVVDSLITLAHAERQQGREPDLSKLYETAVWANPEVREKMLTSQRAADEKQRAADARSKASKAKKASKSVRGTTASAPTADLSVREEIDRARSG